MRVPKNICCFTTEPSYVLVKEGEPFEFFADGILAEWDCFLLLLLNSFTNVSDGQMLTSQIESKYFGFVIILKDEIKLPGLLIFEHLIEEWEGMQF